MVGSSRPRRGGGSGPGIGDLEHGLGVAGLFSGTGQVTFADGSLYRGNFVQGMMDGEGLYSWKNGTTYEGTFSRNTITGHGSFKWANGSSYKGGVVKGLRHGSGTYTDAEGCRYVGRWLQGKRNGQGVQAYPCTAGEKKPSYEGFWLSDCRHGKGTMHYPSGNVYSGEWKHDQRCGYGVMEWLQKGERYMGTWLDDKQHGYGEHAWCRSTSECDAAAVGDTRSKQSFSPRTEQRLMYKGDWGEGKRWGNGRSLTRLLACLLLIDVILCIMHYARAYLDHFYFPNKLDSKLNLRCVLFRRTYLQGWLQIQRPVAC
ncbi:unnamed protein product [Chrysoparadoxa australica]